MLFDQVSTRSLNPFLKPVTCLPAKQLLRCGSDRTAPPPPVKLPANASPASTRRLGAQRPLRLVANSAASQTRPIRRATQRRRRTIRRRVVRCRRPSRSKSRLERRRRSVDRGRLKKGMALDRAGCQGCQGVNRIRCARNLVPGPHSRTGDSYPHFNNLQTPPDTSDGGQGRCADLKEAGSGRQAETGGRTAATEPQPGHGVTPTTTPPGTACSRSRAWERSTCCTSAGTRPSGSRRRAGAAIRSSTTTTRCGLT
ncbi:hypothetical protein CA12_27320 [Alienimonas californiensis]|uniref:Uncharacterized protein n=1 Tax=Alienimonas californiensis TaxID=2527989 RepID=A0A517PB77_9PLAN|nr:hypothetical protein CA12_27320 [Alienimonas californiensis]